MHIFPLPLCYTACCPAPALTSRDRTTSNMSKRVIYCQTKDKTTIDDIHLREMKCKKGRMESHAWVLLVHTLTARSCVTYVTLKWGESACWGDVGGVPGAAWGHNMREKKRHIEEWSDTHGETQPVLPGHCIHVGGLNMDGFLCYCYERKCDTDGWVCWNSKLPSV